MQLGSQLLFFFSAIGAFNGFFLAIYFAFFLKTRNRATYFLAALILVISIRILKSTFLYFYSDTNIIFIQFGLSACALIGPFLYLYIRTAMEDDIAKSQSWMWHVAPPILVMIVFGVLFPYFDNRPIWNFFIRWILYSHWFFYILLSGFQLRSILKTAFNKQEKLNEREVWLLNVFMGVFIVWIAYRTSLYTSYIVGALSFSFVFYIMLLLWVFWKKRANLFFKNQGKYQDKKIDNAEAIEIESRLIKLITEGELYKNPNIKLSDLSAELHVTPHYLSQCLNDNLMTRFADFINKYRVDAASEMLKINHQLTLEAIGQDCGFNSNSSFYTAFKKLQGMTPAQYKRSIS